MRYIFIALAAFVACAGNVAGQERISIAAAANLASVAPSLGSAFSRKYPAFSAEFTFGASGALVTQISNGAPFHLFLSADTSFPQKVVDEGKASGAVRVYAVGTLIFLSRKKLDLSKGLSILADPGVIQFAISNPETTPYGRAAREALQKAGLFEAVKTKIVTAQTVTQALQFTMTGADAGFVNKSALYSKELQPYDREGVYWFAVDPRLHSPIDQGFVVMESASDDPAVTAFADFLVSPDARAILKSFGYGMP